MPRKHFRIYRLAEAIALVAKHGFVHLSIRRDDIEANPCVWIGQNWTPKGQEIAEFRRAYGKYRDNWLGTAYRDKPC